ncbi:MAG: PAC2 family protein [Candidatus Bathyarchaeota archaeon]|nr:PAC2 family protein [Candidatus Bathyarchaeota archaeon]
MDKPYLREMSNPCLDKPTFIQGLPGFGNVGRIAAHLFIKYCNAKPFAELYSPTFPDYVSVSSKGTCRLPRYEFFHAKIDDTDFVVMSGETQPSFEDVLAHYDVCGEIVNYVEKLGCQFVVTIGGVPITEEKAQVYVAATSPRRAAEFMEKGAVIYSRGKIVGGTGLTLALAKERGLEGICLLGATTGFKADKEAGLLAFKFLMKALGKEIKEGLPETQ